VIADGRSRRGRSAPPGMLFCDAPERQEAPFFGSARMPVPLDYVVAALVTLLVVVDPVGLTPAFLGITAGLPRAARRQVAIRACLIAFAIPTGAARPGDWPLRTPSISLAAFRHPGRLPS